MKIYRQINKFKQTETELIVPTGTGHIYCLHFSIYLLLLLFVYTQHDDRSMSVENPPRIPDHHLFHNREFTFPESSAKRRKELPSQPSIVPALTPRIRDTPLQAKIEKLAKQKRKDRVGDLFLKGLFNFNFGLSERDDFFHTTYWKLPVYYG